MREIFLILKFHQHLVGRLKHDTDERVRAGPIYAHTSRLTETKFTQHLKSDSVREARGLLNGVAVEWDSKETVCLDVAVKDNTSEKNSCATVHNVGILCEIFYKMDGWDVSKKITTYKSVLG